MVPRVLLSDIKKQVISFAVAVAALFLLTFFGSFVAAAGETVTANANAVTEVKEATPITGIQVNGSDDSTVPVKLLVTNGSLAMSTTTGITFSGSSTGSVLNFSGTRSNVNAALASLTYTRNTTGSDTLEISLVSPGEVFFSGNGHLYEYVASTLTWGGAKTAAEGRTKYGATGYLTTITSQEENDFVSDRLSNAGWMGASDVASEGVWRWVTGPESGTQFCSGNNPCNSVSGRYANWNSGEPNDSSNNEDCGQFLSGGSGQWNDLPCSGTTLPGYVVEYGAPGDMPTVASANVAITTADTTAPTTPVISAYSSPTTDTTPTISWSSSNDNGTGLNSPAYTMQWSTAENFNTVSGSSTTNSTSLTVPSSLADGEWYFRVQATDNADNVATSLVYGPVIVDTTGPELSLDTSPDVSTNLDSARFEFSGIDALSDSITYECSLDDAEFSVCVSPVDYENLTQGEHTFALRASDGLGNETIEPVLYTWEIIVDSTNDRNNDGTIDTQQSNVATVMSEITSRPVTLAVDEDCSIDTVLVTSDSTNTVKDSGYSYPQGLSDFTLSCGTPGYTRAITLYYYGVEKEGMVVRKYNPNTQGYSTIRTADLTQLSMGGQVVTVVTYQVTDGGELDVDGAANGAIVDPVGLGKLVVGVPNTGFGKLVSGK